MLIYGFLAVKQIRNSPGDIIFMLAVTDLAMAISNAYYSYKIITDGQQDPYGKTCLNTAIVTSVASDLNDMYNLSFFVFFILSIRGSLKPAKIPFFFYHLIPLIAETLKFYYEYVNDHLGMSIYGNCQLKTNVGYMFNIVGANILVFLLFVVFPIFAAFYTRKHLPASQKVTNTRE